MGTEIEEKIILAIDDMPEVLINISDILGKKYDVRPVKSAAAAMLLLQNQKVDLILLDIDMPVLSGFDFQEITRRRPGLDNIPVIFITSLTHPDVISKIRNSGAAGFISKPFTAKELRLRVSSIFC